MYNDYYGFREKPFSLSTSPRYFYLSQQHKKALVHLKFGLMDRAGIILMTGDVGTGKTTLVQHVTSRLAALDSLQVVMVNNTSVIDTDILGLVNDELGIVSEPGAQSRMRALRALEQHLLMLAAKERRVLLVVDEAQALRDSQLEEIRMLSNLQSDEGFLLQVMLSAQPELRERLSGGAYSQLTQRIAVACELEPMNLPETVRYIHHRLSCAGYQGKGHLFDKGAVRLIHKASRGIARLVNNLCNTALMYGLAEEAKVIDEAVVTEVVKDRVKTGLPLAPEKGAARVVAGSQGLERIRELERIVSRLSRTLEKHINSPVP